MGDEFINQVISSISHELRTPLSVISSNIQLLRKFNYSIDDDIANDTFTLCDEAVKSMNRFIDNVHFLNRLNKGSVSLSVRQLNLSDFLKSFVVGKPVLHGSINRLNIEQNISDKLFKTDEELLNILLSVLIDNALRYSAETVNVYVNNHDEILEVLIEDKGMGIPKDEEKLIYEPFYRCRNVKLISGCGLGLAIANKIIGLLKGSISFESIPNKGTTVKLIVPNYES